MTTARHQRSPLGAFYRSPLGAFGPGVGEEELRLDWIAQHDGTDQSPSGGFGRWGFEIGSCSAGVYRQQEHGYTEKWQRHLFSQQDIAVSGPFYDCPANEASHVAGFKFVGQTSGIVLDLSIYPLAFKCNDDSNEAQVKTYYVGGGSVVEDGREFYEITVLYQAQRYGSVSIPPEPPWYHDRLALVDVAFNPWLGSLPTPTLPSPTVESAGWAGSLAFPRYWTAQVESNSLTDYLGIGFTGGQWHGDGTNRNCGELANFLDNSLPHNTSGRTVVNMAAHSSLPLPTSSQYIGWTLTGDTSLQQWTLGPPATPDNPCGDVHHSTAGQNGWDFGATEFVPVDSIFVDVAGSAPSAFRFPLSIVTNDQQLGYQVDENVTVSNQ